MFISIKVKKHILLHNIKVKHLQRSHVFRTELWASYNVMIDHIKPFKFDIIGMLRSVFSIKAEKIRC